uniref:Chromo domain-containing protein n=1 Tax=Syphacia muris TaxID=451379 RepID=A0A0N5ALL3_9BILA
MLMSTCEGTYEVEDIVDERIGKDGRSEFRVRWRTYTEDDDTWEPLENLDDFCTPMIEAMRLKKNLLKKEPKPVLTQQSGTSISPNTAGELQVKVKEQILDDEKNGSDLKNSAKTLASSNFGRRGRCKGGGPRLLKNLEKRSSRKTHWEHRTLEVLTPEAWNKYGDLEKREISNLYIPDRIPTETEKLLCEFHPEVGRVTRNQLKAMRATQVKVEPDDKKTSDNSKKGGGRKAKSGGTDKHISVATKLSASTTVSRAVKLETDMKMSSVNETQLGENSCAEMADEQLSSCEHMVKNNNHVNSSLTSDELLKKTRGRSRGLKQEQQKKGNHRDSNKTTINDSETSSAQQKRDSVSKQGRGRGGLDSPNVRKRSAVSDSDGRGSDDEEEHNKPKKKGRKSAAPCGTPRKRGRKKLSISLKSKYDSCSSNAAADEADKGSCSGTDEPSSSTDPSSSMAIVEDKLIGDDIADRKIYDKPLDSEQSSVKLEEGDLLEPKLSITNSSGRCRRTVATHGTNSSLKKALSNAKALEERKLRRTGKVIKKKAKRPGSFEKDKNVTEATVLPDSSSKDDGVMKNNEECVSNEELKNITETSSNTVVVTPEETSGEANLADPIPSGSGTDSYLIGNRQSAHPLIAEFSDFPIPRAPSSTTLNELMLRFPSLEQDDGFMPAQTISELRTAVLQGNISVAKGSLRHCMWRNSALHLDEKRFGKNLVMEVCEKNCDDAHIFDDMLRLLVYAGARLDTVDDARGRTPLHISALKEHWCHLRVLLTLRSPVNVKDKEGRTPLEIVISSRASNFHVVRAIYLLLEYGADVNDIIEHTPKNRFVSRLVDYREKLTKHFDEARQKVLIDMTVKRCITPVIVRGLWECYGKSRFIQYDFKHESCYLPNVRYMYIIVLALFDYRGPRLWKVRMWGSSPFSKVLLNRKPARSLQASDNGFIYAAELQNGFNQLHLQVKEGATWKKLLVLTQVLLVQLHKPMLIIPPPPLEVAPESGTDWRKD